MSFAFVECAAPAVGIETGDILDSQLTASSGETSQARLNGQFAWCPLSEGVNEYIQVGIFCNFNLSSTEVTLKDKG